ncbi:MAG TPA: hypothetical protein VJS39_07600 [Gemmatimonadaceae bacterium]|nr:hypothetical protein [Gemmatimonadaceae bacterium]
MSIKNEVLATYEGAGDTGRGFTTNYYPTWIDNLADDVTIEGSLMDGAVQGGDAVRNILVAIRALYEQQEFNFAGPCGNNGWLEDYIARVRGQPIGCVVVVSRNA